MSKLDTLRCLLGVHAWSRWRKHNDLGPTLLQRRFCQRCGQVQHRPWRGRTRKPGEAGREAEPRAGLAPRFSRDTHEPEGLAPRAVGPRE